MILIKFTEFQSLLYTYLLHYLFCSESEGSFQYGHYLREADDLRSVVEYFTGTNRRITSILGHSKGKQSKLVQLSIDGRRMKHKNFCRWKRCATICI